MSAPDGEETSGRRRVSLLVRAQSPEMMQGGGMDPSARGNSPSPGPSPGPSPRHSASYERSSRGASPDGRGSQASTMQDLMNSMDQKASQMESRSNSLVNRASNLNSSLRRLSSFARTTSRGSMSAASDGGAGGDSPSSFVRPQPIRTGEASDGASISRGSTPPVRDERASASYEDSRASRSSMSARQRSRSPPVQQQQQQAQRSSTGDGDILRQMDDRMRRASHRDSSASAGGAGGTGGTGGGQRGSARSSRASDALHSLYNG